MTAATPEQAAYEMWDSLLSCDGPIEWGLCEGDVQAKWKHIAEAAIAAQQPQTAPDQLRTALETIASGAQDSLDTGIALDREWVIDQALSALGPEDGQ